MDASRFTTADVLKIIGSAVFVVFGLFNWVGNEGAPTYRAFEWPLSGTLPWILLLGVGVVSLLLALGVVRSETAPWPLIILIAAALATLLNLVLVAAGRSSISAAARPSTSSARRGCSSRSSVHWARSPAR